MRRRVCNIVLYAANRNYKEIFEDFPAFGIARVENRLKIALKVAMLDGF